MLKYKQKVIGAYLLFTITLILLVAISPRFGYVIVDEFSNTKYTLSDVIKNGSRYEAIYASDDNNEISLSYETRFLGNVQIYLNNSFEYEFNVKFDSACSDVSGSDENVKYFMYNIISSDSGSFFFLSFLKPVALATAILACLLWRKKEQSFKKLDAFNCIYIIAAILSILMSLRIL